MRTGVTRRVADVVIDRSGSTSGIERDAFGGELDALVISGMAEVETSTP